MPGEPEDSSVTAQPPAQLPPILRLPYELLLLIVDKAVLSDAKKEEDMIQAAHTTAALSQTCRQFRALTQEVSLARHAQQLVTLIVQGKAEQAKAMIRANPKLMFVKIKGYVATPGSGIDDNGTAVHGKVTAQSPLQVALGEGDGDIYRHMASFFDKVLDDNEKPIGRERAKKQFYEKFPGGNIKYPPCKYDVNKAGMPFSSIINAITHDTELLQDRDHNENRKPNSRTEDALAKFRDHFMPGLITKGHHVNLNNLLNAFELYVQFFANWNLNQRSLFWCQVIGYLQRLVPAVDAQAFCQGLADLQDKGLPLVYDLELQTWHPLSKVSYFSDHGYSGLGFNFAVDSGMGKTASNGAHWGAESRLHLATNSLRWLCSDKTAKLGKFKYQLEQEPELQNDSPPKRRLTT